MDKVEIHLVSKVFGFDVSILFCLEPFGTVCFSDGQEKYYYRIHNVRPVLLNGDPPQELDKNIKDWMMKRNREFCLAFGEAACSEIPARIIP